MSADKIHESALKLFENQLYEQTLRLVNYGLKVDSAHGRLWELKGMVHRVQHEVSHCIDTLQTAAKLTRLKPISKCALADCLLHNGLHRQARQLYMEVYDDPLSTERMYFCVASGLAYLEEWGLCVTVCREWCRDVHDAARARFQLAFALANTKGDVDEILDVAWEGVGLSDDQLGYRISFAILAMHLKEPHEAYRFVSTLTRFDLTMAGCGCALRNLGDIYKAAGDVQRSGWCREILDRPDE